MTNALTSGLIIENNKATGIKVVSSGRFKRSTEEKTFYAGKDFLTRPVPNFHDINQRQK